MTKIRHHIKRHTKRVTIGVLGGIVVLLGAIMIPYPGPGWLVVFTGLAILATEFEFAKKWLEFAKGKYDAWLNWLKKQNKIVQWSVLAFTGLVIVVTVWLLNTFGLINNILNLNQDWLISPFFK